MPKWLKTSDRLIWWFAVYMALYCRSWKRWNFLAHAVYVKWTFNWKFKVS